MTSNRKPPGMKWESFAERQIREAEENGAFAKLPGLGKPIPGIDDPLDENWWMKRKLQDEGVNAVPPVIEARLAVERFREGLARLASETAVRRGVAQLNEMIRAAHYSPVAGPPDGVRALDVEEVVEHWRALRSEAAERPQ
jgi:DnaJ homologue, subfamily C, member 28, conserved domain